MKRILLSLVLSSLVFSGCASLCGKKSSCQESCCGQMSKEECAVKKTEGCDACKVKGKADEKSAQPAAK